MSVPRPQRAQKGWLWRAVAAVLGCMRATRVVRLGVRIATSCWGSGAHHEAISGRSDATCTSELAAPPSRRGLAGSCSSRSTPPQTRARARALARVTALQCPFGPGAPAREPAEAHRPRLFSRRACGREECSMCHVTGDAGRGMAAGLEMAVASGAGSHPIPSSAHHQPTISPRSAHDQPTISAPALQATDGRRRPESAAA